MGWIKRRRWLVALLAAVILFAAVVLGMAYFVPDKLRNIALKIGGFTSLAAQLLPATLPEASKVDQAYWLPQNWSWQKRYWFHHTSQGTTTIPVPYDWFLALERPELSLSHRHLKDDDYLRRLGFIPSPSSRGFDGKAPAYGYHGDAQPEADAAKLDWIPTVPDNPDALPVGFARLKGGTDPTTGETYEDQLGLTCAACHTGHLEYKNVSIRFDGGPAMVNLGEVERAVGLSIGYTLQIPLRFSRFASRLEEIRGQPVDRKKLEEDLQATLNKIFTQKGIEKELLQGAPHADEGFGRLDALNRIGNQVFFTNFLDRKTGTVSPLLDENFARRVGKNFARNDAPVSFPPIWDTPFFLWAQYDASVFNELVRNAGEALGVNARVNMTAKDRPLFASSVDMLALERLEELLRGTDPFKTAEVDKRKFNGLVAPRWDDARAKFTDGAWNIDDKLADEGRELYRSHCFECHRGPVRDKKFDAKWPEDSFWKETNSDSEVRKEANWIKFGGQHYFNVVQKPVGVIGTDRQQARVLTERRVALPESLGLAAVDHLNKEGNCRLPPEEAADVPFVLALMAVVDKTIHQWFEAQKTSEETRKRIRGPRPNCQNPRVFVGARAGSPEEEKPVIAIVPHYRARPLDGVWATAPYLHNGSVPTLRDMLLPQDERAISFCVGSREFDPVDVGLVVKTGKDARSKRDDSKLGKEGAQRRGDENCAAGLTVFEVSLQGNSNRGHSFEAKGTDKEKWPAGVIGPGFSEDQRRALIAYLKTL